LGWLSREDMRNNAAGAPTKILTLGTSFGNALTSGLGS
jgi:hypothetical protein